MSCTPFTVGGCVRRRSTAPPWRAKVLSTVLFRRRHPDPPARGPEARVLSVRWDDDADERRCALEREHAWRELQLIVAEAVIRQDQATELLRAISRREPLRP